MVNNLNARIVGNVSIKPYKGYVFLTASPLGFFVGDKKFTIPENFQTDLSSIPRIFWCIIAPYNTRLIAPAIVHDWLYNEKTEYNRLEIDTIFYNLLVNNNISKITANIMYYAVRIFGLPFFR